MAAGDDATQTLLAHYYTAAVQHVELLRRLMEARQKVRDAKATTPVALPVGSIQDKDGEASTMPHPPSSPIVLPRRLEVAALYM
jgi:hypothetical protein